MLLEKFTGVTKKTLRITKPIGAIEVRANQGFAGVAAETTGWDNEQISVVIESGSQTVKVISPACPVPLCAALSTLAEGAAVARAAADTQLRIDIGFLGSLQIDDSAEIVVTLTNLKAGKEYSVFGKEVAGVTRRYFAYDQKTLLAGRKNEQFNMVPYESFIMNGFARINKLEIVKLSVLPSGAVDATNHSYEPEELYSEMAATNDFVLNGAISIPIALPDTLALPSAQITRMELDVTGAAEHTVVLRRLENL